ncbi:nickel ABC transporter permease [Kosakonia radicincitans DSM 16656]|uniref:Peptide/nickel transport system permease protein n=1 Tax=Kosakonia radicincitans TaxID=283686 RepID=A0AAX2EM07_9ENTR|nr:MULTISPECIES: ABC transporter permease [Kosakonia]MDP9564936.1 peptide/nickel transport system permease protein [Kosakonia oryzae]APG17066.1 nickel ABC transporter permease [Kosakonia radicincitans]ARD62038.1 nickel ABC transporter permease [Kosakonia radicincitans DSM 16656]KDE33742.1 nickel ABC transporter permease [Kosakonia radicincitans UMEnt01/12]MDD7997131.1 ABC transporter permease [Kosakonia radicincitans]
MSALSVISGLRRRAIPRQHALRAGIVIVGLWLFIALFVPWLAPFDPITQDAASSLLPPGGAHLFGTDNFGRDIFSRVLWGARVDLQICLLGVIFPFLLGTTLGALSGYLGGVVDAAIMRLIDIVLAFPFLVLMLAIIAILGPGLGSFYIAMAMVGWVSYARLVRAQVLTLKQRDFIVAARSLGYGHARILFRHLLPNAITGALVFSMSDCVLVLLNGAAVSYLGLGVQPPTAEWGVMVAEGQSFITTAWWITTFPGLAIVLLAMGFSLLADGLGDKLGARV